MWRLADLAAAVGAELVGDGEVRVNTVATLEHAGPEAISFLANPRYRPLLANSAAAAVIVAPGDREGSAHPRLVSSNPYACYARVAQLLHPASRPVPGIHPSAIVDASAEIAAGVSIGPHAVIGTGVRLGPDAVIGAGCSLADGVSIGARSRLHERVVIYPQCVLGEDCLIHAGVVIGADGFGMAWSGSDWIKIPQIGGVRVGNRVEIGANTTVDRGAIDDTVIEDGVKLDNLIQIGHNVHIGAHTVIAGCTGISGSARIGSRCRIGGGVGIVGHVDICDGTTVSGFSLITKSITEAGVYTSSIPSLPHRTWMHTLAALRGLPELSRTVRELEARSPPIQEEGPP